MSDMSMDDWGVEAYGTVVNPEDQDEKDEAEEDDE